MAKDLTELAMRRRTYVVRAVYALVLLFISWMAFHLSVGGGFARPMDYLGSGRVIVTWLGYLQNIGLLLVQPALACDVFTREKERQTIGLLFLTRLSPLTIVFEKFLGRLFPALCLLSISLPLLAISYSLGGVEISEIISTEVGLVTNAILLTSIAVACSAICRTTTAAYIATYLLVVCLPLMVVSGQLLSNPFDSMLFGRYFDRAIFLNGPDSIGLRAGNAVPFASLSLVSLYSQIAVACLPSLVCAMICIMVARVFLVSRAFIPATDPLRWLKVLSVRDLFRRREHGVPRSGRGENDLPDLAPVAWRETRKRWVGEWLAILVGVANALLLSLLWMAQKGVAPSASTILGPWGLFLWLITIFVLVISAAGLIAPERGQETLFVLLTTPLAGADIIRQKVRGLRSLALVCLIPLGSSIVMRMLLEMPRVRNLSHDYVEFPMAFFNEVTMLVIYPQLAIWLAFYFSLKSRTTIAAILKTIFTIVFMCIVPWIILMLFAIASGGLSEKAFGLITALLMIGPADLLLYGYEMESIPPGFEKSFFPVILNTAIHGSLWWGLRSRCLAKADVLLGRNRSLKGIRKPAIVSGEG